MSVFISKTIKPLKTGDQLTIGQLVDFLNQKLADGSIVRSSRVWHIEYGGLTQTMTCEVMEDGRIVLAE